MKDINPPAIVKEAESCMALLRQAKDLDVTTNQRDLANLGDAVRQGKLLLKARLTCAKGDWERSLKQIGIAPRRASERMKIAELPAAQLALCDSIRAAVSMCVIEPAIGGAADLETPPQPAVTETKNGAPAATREPAAPVTQPVISPPPPLLDEEGHVVPEKCKAAFEALGRFKEADSLCRQLQGLIDEAAKQPGGEQLHRRTTPTGSEEKVIYKSEHLNHLKQDLKGTRPYSVCPYCEGKGPKSCKGCTGAGWVTKTTWDGATDSEKEAMCSR